MKNHLWKILLVLVVLVAVLAIPAAAANNTFNIEIDGYQNYDEVNEILNYVNGYRAEVGAAPLKLEPELMKLAMQRAAEIAVYYSHTRPNNSSYDSIIKGTIFANLSFGENIAIGQRNAQEVSTDWRNSSGHYANMVQPAYKSIGIGCFYQEDGTRCWVQLFSDVTTSSKNTLKGEKAVKNVPVEASPALVKLSVSTIDDCNMGLYEGQRRKIQVTAVNQEFTYKTTILSDCFSVSSEDTKIAKVEGTSLVGVKKGTTTAYVHLGNIRMVVPVEVFATPTMSYTQDQFGRNVVTWDDPTGNSILFYKILTDDEWIYAGAGGKCTLWSLGQNEACICVLRVWDGNEYIDINEMIVGDLELQITSQPTTQKIKAGVAAKFTVAALGNGLKYQWQYRTSSSGSWKNVSAASGKTANYSMTAETRHSGYQYRCKVTDSAGDSKYTKAVSLYVLGIKTQPTTQKLKAGATAKFTVSATGANKTYQWQYKTSSTGSWKNVSAASGKTASYSMSAQSRHNGYYYRCRVTDGAGNTVYTKTVRLYVLAIRTQPVSRTVVAGKTAKFTVSATGNALKYQWQYRTSSSGSWKSVSAASGKTAAYSMTAAVRHHGYQYRCKVTDSAGNVVYTNAATLYVLGIKTQPVNKTVTAGATAKFTAAASGTGLKYQWQYRTSSSGSWKNVSTASAKKASYSLTAQSRHNGYQYRCKITDAKGNVIYTSIVKLTVKSVSQTTYILNTDSMKFHEKGCSSAAIISDHNREDYNGTREELLEMGYSPCGRCDP